jgi:hypothetical protein
MSDNVALAIRPRRVVQDRIALVIRARKKCRRWSIRVIVQSDVQLADVLQRGCGDAYDVGPVVVLRQVDELVPYGAELVLEVGGSMSEIEAAK